MQHTSKPATEDTTPAGAGEPAAVVAARYVANGFLPASLTAEGLDRVRWAHLVYGGKFSGEYEQHVSPAEVKDREPATKKILAAFGQQPGPSNGRAGFGDGKTYGELFLAEVSALLAEKYRPRSRTVTVKTTSADEEI